MTELTIGVPVFNGERFLDGCLANLAAQTPREILRPKQVPTDILASCAVLGAASVVAIAKLVMARPPSPFQTS